MFSLVAQPQVVLTTTLCESGAHQTRLLRKVEAALEAYATGLPVHGHLVYTIGRPMSEVGSPSLGDRIAELVREQSPGDRATGIRSRRPCAFGGTSSIRESVGNCHNWHWVLRLAPVSFPS